MTLTDLEITLDPNEQSVLWTIAAIGGAVEASTLTMRSGVDAEVVLDFLRVAKRLGLIEVELRHTRFERGGRSMVSTSYGPISLTPRGEHVAAQIAARLEREAAAALA